MLKFGEKDISYLQIPTPTVNPLQISSYCNITTVKMYKVLKVPKSKSQKGLLIASRLLEPNYSVTFFSEIRQSIDPGVYFSEKTYIIRDYAKNSWCERLWFPP